MNEAKAKNLLNLVRTYYIKESHQSDSFKTYLKEKRITLETALELSIGYANSGNSVSEIIASNKEHLDLCIETGLIFVSNGRLIDRFQHMIMFSLNDINGDCIGFYGSPIEEKLPKIYKYFMLKQSLFLYGIDSSKHFEKKGTVLVVEGISDYLALYQKGIMNVVATLGTFSEEQLIFLNILVPEIILGFDGDETGKKATIMVAELMDKIGIIPYVIDYDSHLDAKSFVENESDAVKKIKDKMNSAKTYRVSKI